MIVMNPHLKLMRVNATTVSPSRARPLAASVAVVSVSPGSYHTEQSHGPRRHVISVTPARGVVVGEMRAGSHCYEIETPPMQRRPAKQSSDVSGNIQGVRSTRCCLDEGS